MSILNALKFRSPSFEDLIRPHLKGMYYQAYRFLKDQSDAEDLVQDFTLRLYKNKANLHEIEHLRSWLYKGLYRQFLNFIRNNTHNPLNNRDNTEDNDVESSVYHEYSPELLTEQEMELSRVEDALAKLSQNHHHLIIMHDIEGFTLAEIAEIMDTPIGTLKSRLHRARANLKNKLVMEPISPNQCVKS